MSEYYQVGRPVEYGDTLVDYAEAERLRQFVATDLMMGAKYVQTEVSDDSDVLRYAFNLRPIDPNEDGMTRVVSVRLAHASEPESWQMAIRERKLDGQRRDSGKWTDYRFEAMCGEQLLVAKKQVYMLRGSRDAAVSRRGVISETLTSSRTMFERPLVLDDCKTIYGMLERTLKRARVSGR